MTKTSRNAAVTTPTHSAETIACNDDLLDEILLRLPIKSLIRFKSVSKHWLSLISAPKFALRRNPNPGPASGLFLKRPFRPEFEFLNLDRTSESGATLRSLDFAAGDTFVGVGIVQSCNGLMLCSAQSVEPGDCYVYNPTINRHRIIPPIPPARSGASRTVFGLSLAFDPSKSPHYSVVCVRSCDTRSDQYQLEVYSSETRRWRPSGGSFYVDSPDIRFDRGVFWNGSVHWISIWGESVYFSVEEDRLRPMPMPPIPDDWDAESEYTYFGESGGHLHLIDHIYNPHTPYFDVYELEKDYSGWLVKFRVDFSEFPAEAIRNRKSQPSNLHLHDYVFSLLCVVRSELDEESYLVLQIKGKVIRYYFRTRTFGKICDVEGHRIKEPVRIRDSVLVMLPELPEWHDVHQFIESLASV
ncbi:F-box domain containing protein [Trema orientale]|uniref:F-box domain containing protein n=1 Tax=Trema orientale TaxID=63057 RepID=A0A2P5F3N3_TREOI|nr:F-box domain containing protein [Trema orientale]